MENKVTLSDTQAAEVFRALYYCRTKNMVRKRARYRVMERMTLEFTGLRVVSIPSKNSVSHSLFYNNALIVEVEE